MLSIGTLSSGHVASGYYKSEGYYIADSPEAERSAIYHGKGAAEAGFVGRVIDDDFSALLDGQAPDGRTLGRFRGGERQHRAGLDLTFSAPKSVSIAALVAGDKRIIAAHTEAVKTALDYAEANLVQTRRMVNGEIVRETGGKIIAGLFQHDTSRALDPQLHTHAVIANVIKDSTGTYRALSNEALFNGKMLLGQIYRNALAERLEQLGYEIKPLEKGLFDIEGIPEVLTQTFSKRRNEIEQALKDRNYEPTAVSSALAALATRASKKPVERAELRAAWDAEVKALGIDLDRTLRESQSARTSVSDDIRQTLVERAVDFAVTKHAERNSIYALTSVIDVALKYAPTVTERAVTSELDRQISAGTLIPVERHDGRFLTDVENVRLETENVRLMASVVDRPALDLRSKPERLTRRSSDAIVVRKLNKTTLTSGQREAVAIALSSNSRVVGIQGYAGTGKTYALATAVRMAEARGYSVDGLAPSHKAVSSLGETVPNSATVESALVRYENGANFGDKSRSILVVDEASMLSSEGMNRVLRMARSARYARTVLVGDIKQLEAVGAGSAYRALQNAGMPTALMADIQRQRSEGGRQAVLAAISGDINKALSGIADVSEVGGKGTLETRARIGDQLAEIYSALSREDRATTGLIVLTNALRRAVNVAIQDNLKLSGEIGGGQVEISSLVPKNFTQAEAAEIGSYKPGDIVLSPVATPRSGLTSNTLYAVTAVDRSDRRLTLSGPDGEVIVLDLDWKNRAALRLAVFGTETQTFIEGDRVKFRITDRQHGIVNSAEGTLKMAGRKVFKVRTPKGEDLSIPADSLAAKGMQLAYATTAHDFQGSTVDRVLFGMSSVEQLATQKAFYVAISRMRDSTHLVTDDVGKLAAQIQRETGERVNALEALAEERERLRTVPNQQYDGTRSRTARVAVASREDLSEGQKSEPGQSPRRMEKNDSDESTQLSLLDTLQNIQRDQKTRDERSR